MRELTAVILGVALIIAAATAAIVVSDAVTEVKALERSVTVKGLSEREYLADTVIWPIQFTSASNDLAAIYQEVEASKAKIVAFLLLQGIAAVKVVYSQMSNTLCLRNEFDFFASGSKSSTYECLLRLKLY